MKSGLKKHLNLIIVGLMAVLFFASTSTFNLLAQTKDYVKWSSPDETANYFFAREFATTGRLAVFDPAAVIGDNMVMPRSVRSDFGWLKPVSFLGVVLTYGTIGRVLGPGVIPFLTPFFGALGIVIFYLLVRRIFRSERVGLIAAVLLAVFPVYVYYSARSMFHNILFIVALLAAAYLLILALGKKREKAKGKFVSWSLGGRPWWEFVAALAAGLLFGLAAITRSSELLWLLPAVFIVWLFYARRLGVTKLVIFLAGIFLAFWPVFYYNQVLYNSFWHGGYNEMNRSLDDISRNGGALIANTLTGQLSQLGGYAGAIYKNIFYFGFHPGQSAVFARHYISDMFPWLLYGAAAGLLIMIGQNIRRFKKKYLVYVLAGLVVSGILILYYGSWKFNDNPDPGRFTIGNSYTRYWLPIYLLLIPLFSLALVKISRALALTTEKTKDWLRRLAASSLQGAVVLVIVFISLMFVLVGSEEGLVFLYQNNLGEKANTERVFSLTEPGGIIITRYYDKFFWPERRVIMGTLPDDQILTAAAKLLKYYPVYYYNFYLDQAAVDYLNSRKFPAYNLKMTLVNRVNGRFGLYKLYQIPPPGAAATSSAVQKYDTKK